MMKFLSSTLSAFALLTFLLSPRVFAQEKSSLAWTIGEKDLIPEGIAFDSRTKTFYLSSTYLRKIISIDKKGKVKDFTGEADGLRGVLGMRVDAKRRVLWALSGDLGLSMPLKGNPRDCLGCSEVFKYDLESGKLIKKYILSNKSEPHFLNDLTITSTGDVYLTDTIHGGIYFIAANGSELTEFINLGKDSYPNGIDLSGDEKTLFVALNGRITAVDLQTKTNVSLALPPDVKIGVIDGLYFYKNSLIAIQPFETGKTIVRYYLNDKRTSVVKTEIIEASHRFFNQPTTGVVVKKELYYIANSQLQHFRKLFQPDGSFDKSKLSDVYILKVKIEKL